MLRLENLSIYRNELCVANAINSEFEAGKIYAILGPNGAGKTSLISAMFGDLAFKGSIAHKQMELSLKNHFAWKKRIAYMPQDSSVDASLSALEVVLLGLIDQLGMYVSDTQISQALSLMKELGILHLASRDILNLSGGQRQMVLFASVLIKAPEILLLDEPVSALDMHHQCVLLECVRSYTRKEKLITVIILHDLSLASQFADELVVLSDAKIWAQGEAKGVLTKDLIENLYKIKADIFYDESNKPVIVAKSALKTNILTKEEK